MASDAGYAEHVCDQLAAVGNVSVRRMFGEYALYCDGKVAALICDNQLYIKHTMAGRQRLEELAGKVIEGQPYPGAKPYLLVSEHLDDRSLLQAVLAATVAELPLPKPKKPKSAKAKARLAR